MNRLQNTVNRIQTNENLRESVRKNIIDNNMDRLHEKKNITKKLLAAAGCIVLMAGVITGSLLFLNRDTSRYNENPDLSQKIVGSKVFNNSGDSLPNETIEDIFDFTEYIIVGEVVSDGVADQFNMFGDNEVSKADLEAGIDPYIPCTITKIRVEESILGDIPEGSEISFFQLGVPESDGGQTKVKKGERLVMGLQGPNEAGQYLSGDVENTIFYLDENNKVTSMSDELLCARYDGTSKDFLVKDLLVAMENIEKMKSTEGVQ